MYGQRPRRLRLGAFWFIMVLLNSAYAYLEFVTHNIVEANIVNMFTFFVAYDHIIVSDGRWKFWEKEQTTVEETVFEEESEDF